MRRELFGANVRRPADERDRLLRGTARRHACELERIREPLAPVRERALDDSFDATEVGRQSGAAEGDERRVDVRPRAGTPLKKQDGIPFAPTPAARGRTRRRTPWSRAWRRSDRRPRAAPSPSRARSRADGRGSRRSSGVATLYGRLATSFVAPGAASARSSFRASPNRSSTFGRPANRSVSCGPRDVSSSTA